MAIETDDSASNKTSSQSLDAKRAVAARQVKPTSHISLQPTAAQEWRRQPPPLPPPNTRLSNKPHIPSEVYYQAVSIAKRLTEPHQSSIGNLILKLGLDIGLKGKNAGVAY